MKDKQHSKNTIYIVNKSKEFLDLVKKLKQNKEEKIKKLLNKK